MNLGAKELFAVSGRPSHQRVRLGLALRDARLAAGMTQAQAAAAIGRRQPWINKIENAGIAKLKLSEIAELIDALGVEDARADELKKFARAPYDSGGTWVENPGDGTWWQKYREVELAAKTIKAVHLQALDGLLQSPAYMRRQFELGGGLNTEPRIEERLARQQAVLERDSPPDCTFVLDEACLRTNMGDSSMMRGQIAHLLKLSERPHITILVKPFDAPVPSASYGFALLLFNSNAMRDFASVEYEVGAATIDDDASLRAFQERWERVRSAADTEAGSRERLRRELDGYDNTTMEG